MRGQSPGIASLANPQLPTLDEAAVVSCDIVRIAAVCQVGNFELNFGDVVVRVLRREAQAT